MAEAIVEIGQKRRAAGSGWGYVARVFAATFAILLCLAAAKFFGEHKLAPRNSGIQGAMAQPRLDLLLIGSSHTRKAYDMRQLERQTGTGKAFLISYDGADLAAMAQVLDAMCAVPERCPRHVVVEAYSAQLGRRPDLQDPRLFADAPPAMKMAMIRTYLRSHRAPAAYLDIFDLVVNRGNDEIVAAPLYAWADAADSYKGGRTATYFPGMTPEAFRRINFGAVPLRPDGDQLAALNRILDIAAARGIAVIFIDTPMPRPSSSLPGIQALKGDFAAAAEARGAMYVDGDRGFDIDDPELFADSNHLSSKGREMFTAQIAARLKNWLAAD